MKKTNKTLLILLIVILAFSLLALAACQPPEDTDEPDTDDTETSTTDTALVKNGTFAAAKNSDNSNAYVKDSVTSWTPTSGMTTYSTAKVGAVDITRFDANKSAVYENMSSPGIAPGTPKNEDGTYKDTNALVIANTIQDGGSLYYKSAAVTLAKNKHYKLTVDVFTKILNAKEDNLQGVWIYISTGAYAEFQAINTNETWETYTVYIEANNSADRTMYIQLWLGYGPQYIGSSSSGTRNTRMTQGVAFFDNVLMNTITASEYADAFGTYSKNGREVTVVSDTKTTKTAIISLINPDSNFSYVAEYYTSSSSSYKSYFSAKVGIPNSNVLSGQVGKSGIEDTSEFPTSTYSSTAGTVGIFDMSKLFAATYDEQKNFIEYADTFKAITSSFRAPTEAEDFMDPVTHTYRLAGRSDNPADSTALLIFHPDNAISGYGYKSKTNYLIEKDKYYVISVWVYLYVPEYSVTAVAEPEQPADAELSAPNRSDYPEGEAGEEAYQAALTAYNASKAAWDDYRTKKEKYDAYKNGLDAYNAAKDRASATFKLTGATIKEGDLDTQKSPAGGLNQWYQLTYKIKGNELSNRFINLEYWYGEGNWGEDTLMVGGCFFDNVSIQVYTRDTVPGGGSDYKTISPLENEDFAQFGLLEAPADPEFAPFALNASSNGWEYSFEDSNTATYENAGNAGIINGSAALNPALWGAEGTSDLFRGYTMPGTFTVTYDNVPTNFNLVMLRNNIYTSSILKFSNDNFKVVPNSFYRLSFWIYTGGIDDSLGLTAALYKTEGDTSLTSLSKLNTQGEWTEVIFYLQGSSDDTAEFYIKLTLGSGNNYTPANLVKGVVYATAMTYKKIAYTEYNSATTGTYITKYEVPSSTSASNTITNGWFNNIDNTTYSGENEGVFDDNGNLVDVAIPESWTTKAAEGVLTKPTSLTINVSGELNWTGDNKAEYYLIYADELVVDNGSDGEKTINNYYIGKTAGTETTYTLAAGQAQKNAYYKVRAVRVTPETDKPVGYSDFSTRVQYTGNTSFSNYLPNNVEKYFPVMGIIDYKYYDGGSIRDTLYPSNEGASEIYYNSPYDKLLMISSKDYFTRAGYLSPSTGSLTANSYYELSVWMKTVDIEDAEDHEKTRASVTIANKSQIITINTAYADYNANDGDYIGYVNQNTAGQWIRYTFYIKTTKMTSASGIQLELYLGNKYAKDGAVNKGLSLGTVYFDDIYFKKLDSEEQYNKLVYGVENTEDLTDEIRAKYSENKRIKLSENKPNGSLFANNYIYKLVDLTTDSFDYFTEGTSPLGDTPGAYTHYNVTDAEAYSSSDELKKMLYGVYDKRTVMEEIKETVLDANAATAALFADAEDLQTFLTTDVGTGNNYLLLLNTIKNGQYYLSTDSFSLEAGKYYKITFWAKIKAPEGKKAEFRFERGNETNVWDTVYIASDVWTKYTFYIYNSDKSAVSGNQFAFYLGTNDGGEEGSEKVDMFPGLLIVDDVSVVPVTENTEELDALFTAYDALSADQKIASTYNYHKFVATTTEEEEPEEEEDENDNSVNSQLWLLVSSIVIAAILLAVVVVLSWRKISKRIKKNIPVKVISNVPVNMQTKEQRKSAADKKKDISDDEFTD